MDVLETVVHVALGIILLACLIGVLFMALVSFILFDAPLLAKWVLVVGVVGFIVWRAAQ